MGFPLLTIEQFLEWKGSGCASVNQRGFCCYEGNCTPAHEADQHFCDGGGGFRDDTVKCWDPQTGALGGIEVHWTLEDCQEKCWPSPQSYVDGACCTGSTCWTAQEIVGIRTAAEHCEAGDSFFGYGPGVYQGDGTACSSLLPGLPCQSCITCSEEEEEEEEEGLGSIWIEGKNCCCKESPCTKKVAVESTGSTGNIDPTTGLPIGGWGGLPGGGLPGMGGGGDDFEMVSVGAFGDLSCGCSKRLIGEMNSETDPFGTSEVCKFFKVNFIYNEGTHVDLDFYIDALNDSFSDDTTDTSLYGDRKQKDTLIRFEKYKETVLTGGSVKIFESPSDFYGQVLYSEERAETHGFQRNVINIYFADFGTLSMYDIDRAAWAYFPSGGGEPVGFPTAGAIIFPTWMLPTYKNYQHSTMVHELGHSFNLYHTFGDKEIPCDDDGVSDTPLTNENQGVDARTADCGELSMNENWMDYAYGMWPSDPDEFFFTKGQNDRMHRAIKKHLPTYYTSKFCKVVPCDPEFGGDCG
jgi:hypothetical protein